MELDRDNKAAAPRAWVEALERGRADLAAGRTISADVVMAQLREAIAAWPAATAAAEDEPAPRPYAELARPVEASIHEYRYWIVHTVATPPAVPGVFDEYADIQGQYWRSR